MPHLARRCGGMRVMSWPWKRISPDRTGSRPMMLSMMVVRPAPLRPTRETTSPSSTVSDTPCRMCAGPRKVLMASTSSSTWCSFVPSSRQRYAEKDVGDVLVHLDLFRRPVGEESAFMHHHDAVGVAEHDVHVVLDDDGRHRSGAHHRGYGIHDLALVAGADPAGRLVEKEELGPQRIGHGDVEQLALALRQAPRQHGAHALEAELPEHVEGLVADVLVVLGQRGDLHGLAIAREDRHRDIVENGQPVEQVDDLEAARNAGLDPFVHGRERDVVALEQDLAAVGREMRADEIDERGLAGAVRADEREKLPLVDCEVHVVAGAGLAELLAEIDGLEKD